LKNDQEAFNLGRRAYFRGAESFDNPYSEDTEERKHWSWERGFNTAYEEDEEDFIPNLNTDRS
jgi:hypothetical protein